MRLPDGSFNWISTPASAAPSLVLVTRPDTEPGGTVESRIGGAVVSLLDTTTTLIAVLGEKPGAEATIVHVPGSRPFGGVALASKMKWPFWSVVVVSTVVPHVTVTVAFGIGAPCVPLAFFAKTKP